jgi:tetratricopeptide (TPR) repeat protein
VLLLLTGAGAAGLAAWKWRQEPAPQPPEVPRVEDEPAVTRAIQEARDQVTQEPHSGVAWGKLGQVFLAHDFFDDAMVCFEQAQQRDTENPRWPYYRAAVRVGLDPEGVLPLLRRAADLCDAHDPKNAAPRLRLGEALLELGRLDEARTEFLHVAQRDPANARAQFDLGTVAVAAGDLEGARRYFTNCSADRHTRQKAAAQLALILTRAGATAEAAAAERQARELPPDSKWSDPYFAEYRTLAVNRMSQFRHAQDLLAQGRPQEGVALLQRLLEQKPDSNAFQQLAIAMSNLRDMRTAEAALREAARRDPDAFPPQFMLTILLVRQAEPALANSDRRAAALQQLREAVERGQKAVSLKPDHAMANTYLGLAFTALGKRSEALAAFQAAVRCCPEQPDPYLHLAEALAADGQKAQAREVLDKASRLAAPNDPRPRQALERLQAGSAKQP